MELIGSTIDCKIMADNATVAPFLLEVEQCLEGVRNVLTDGPTESQVDGIMQYLEELIEAVSIVEVSLPGPELSAFLDAVTELTGHLQSFVETEIESYPSATRTCNGNTTRLDISAEHLIYLIECGFNLKDIAKFFNCSSKTIQRRIAEYGIQDTWSFTNVSQTDLDEIASLYIRLHPRAGYRSFQAFLCSQGLKVKREHVRDCMLRIDPSGVSARLRQCIQRRTYSVPGPNSLWHLDGNHKLIRWRIVIHGCVDGYSRLPVFLQASTNNRASTVLPYFIKATQQFGMPSRVRCDKGGENSLVSYFMLCHPDRGPQRHSCITGRSVHNQRIERLWRDVYNGCTSYFHNLFNRLEDAGVLDPDNEVDLLALHYTYVPWIQHQLDLFRDTWSMHRLHTCESRSPLQLWLSGFLGGSRGEPATCSGISIAALDRTQATIDTMGLDPAAFENLNAVHVPEFTVSISEDCLSILQQHLNPSNFSVNDCDELYISVRVFLQNALT